MTTREKPAGHIVRAPMQALAMRSAALVARGLRDLARDSNWLVKKIFTGRSPRLAVSSTGQVGAISPPEQHSVQRVVVYDIELSVPSLPLSIPGEAGSRPPDSPATLAWSPTSRYLVAAWGAGKPELHVFDLHEKMLLGTFGACANLPEFLAWSDTGKHFAAAASGGERASLRLWEAKRKEMPLSGRPVRTVGPPDWIEPQTFGEGFAEEGSFSGYGRIAFSPDGKTLVCVAEIQGDWADDSIAILDVPTLRRQNAFQAQGHITDLTWTSNSQEVIYCAAGQAYRLAANIANSVPLPFGAELCACHPHLPLCVCFSSWLKNSAKGRLFLADLSKPNVFDEYAAEGVVDLRWSLDGSKAYAVTQDGLAYVYDPPLI
jgi:WD40 repeat protein